MAIFKHFSDSYVDLPLLEGLTGCFSLAIWMFSTAVLTDTLMVVESVASGTYTHVAAKGILTLSSPTYTL